jgi:hypothetical protein
MSDLAGDGKKKRRVCPRRCRRAAAGALAVYLLIAWMGGCAQPVKGLWPPAAGEPSYHIVVSTDQWHSVIGLWPLDDPEGRSAAGLEEWSYAEKGYYLEGDSGCSGTLRALFVPSAGVLQESRLGRPWSERTPQPPARQWSFRLSERGYRALRSFLESEGASGSPIVEGESSWYAAAASYHLFHQCHHWTARALREAGLPFWSFYAFFKWSLEAQLDRALRFDPPPAR